jgi:hypothetical protein
MYWRLQCLTRLLKARKSESEATKERNATILQMFDKFEDSVVDANTHATLEAFTMSAVRLAPKNSFHCTI